MKHFCWNENENRSLKKDQIRFKYDLIGFSIFTFQLIRKRGVSNQEHWLIKDQK